MQSLSLASLLCVAALCHFAAAASGTGNPIVINLDNTFKGEEELSVDLVEQSVLTTFSVRKCDPLSSYLRSNLSTDGESISRAQLADNKLLVQNITQTCKDSLQKSRGNWATWIMGVVIVSVISATSLVGALVIPFMEAKVYQTILTFMVSLAVSSLSGSSLFHLIPNAFGLVAPGVPHDFLYKAAMAIFGIYLFFFTERFIKLVMYLRKRSGDRDNPDGEAEELPPICSVKGRPVHYQKHINELPTRAKNESCTIEDCSNAGSSVDVAAAVDGKHPHGGSSNQNVSSSANGVHSVENGYGDRSDGPGAKSERAMEEHVAFINPQSRNHQGKPHESKGGCKHGHAETVDCKRPIATVAWMVILGDGIHNFIDGLAIGAACVTGPLTALSTAVAVIAEELPHELGDFAILLSAGMTWKQALFYNFLSALSCFGGMVIGILLGELAEASGWIFALAGGMFLYISLVDMMPEMSEESEKDGPPNIGLFLLQTAGLFTGWTLMFLFALYGGNITLPDWFDW